ncbi:MULTISPECIES: serine/threonine-protein kinase [Streptomyces]|uniref:non-specific serine/threonine protein kinase n=2 Tax=Streptomyces TaxID=1883 RepID=A0A5P2BIG2_STRVZ|nr:MULTISPECIES: serine/threonine-protein kinase [Streptomyces]MYY80162.1 protein kinase [Streptomyces sp. SID335]MYZ13063.1 protein kinase [Streptomyces sp. SID337]NEB46466.1 serine/threonine protein kinase [Streptomyces sp. SID339]QES28921.1 serine/threonine protein kinase [Streptomyces venezuelae]
MGSLGDHAGAAGGGNARVIAGRYRLEAPLGRGGMGVVWRATDLLLGRRVAVKELARDETLSDAEAEQRRERTLREARAVAQLRHPHVIVVHDVVVQDEQPYIVMELIEGGSLAGRIARGGPLDAHAVARMGIDLLGALSTAHDAGILHRDLKPANVLLERGTDRVVLTDFGIAQLSGATTLTEVGSFVGSPEYTAPERMAGERTGPESDLWSLGALLVTALAGESPFRRDSIGGVLHAVVFDEIRPSAAVDPLLPVVLGLLDRDPDQRMGAAEAEGLLRVYVETGRMPAVVRERPGAGLPGHSGRSGLPGLHGLPGRSGRGAPTPAERELLAAQAAAGLVKPEKHGRTFMIAAALVAALAGAGVSAALLLTRDGDGGGTPAPPASATATQSSPTPTVTVTSPTARPSSPQAPQGYRIAKDPKGFALAVPEGFRRQVEGARVFYESSDGTYRIGIEEAAAGRGGPLAAQRRADASGPRDNPGYRDGRVSETTRNGRPAALREFTWDGLRDGKGDRRSFDLCWEEGGRRFDVWVSAPVGEAAQARRYFDAAVDTFVRR